MPEPEAAPLLLAERRGFPRRSPLPEREGFRSRK